MLNKELLRIRTTGEYIRPQFIPVDSAVYLDLAKSLLSIYTDGIGRTKEFLDGMAENCVNLMKDVKAARGIWKVLSDKTEFAVCSGMDWKAKRREVFHNAAKKILAGQLPEQPGEMRMELAGDLPELYADLPEKETLLKVKKMFPKELLERYNMALVQSLLLRTAELELHLNAGENPQLLRALFRYLKFFRLLAEASMEKNTIKLTVSGPASILENSTKYGLQTASFFPIVCRLSDWRASCMVKLEKGTKKLLLSPASGLVCHFTNFSSYQPEEIRMFASFFHEKSASWLLDEAPGFLRGEDSKLIFPDFSFQSKNSRKTYYVELFHRWHISQLRTRLKECEQGLYPGLVIGVDRSLLKLDPVLQTELKISPYFERSGFLFRDFPGVENVEKILESQEAIL